MDMRFIVEVSVLETVVLHSGIDAHKKTSHFSCPRNGRQLKNEAGLFLPSGREDLLGYELLQFC